MKIKYFLTEGTLTLEDGQLMKTYGISAYKPLRISKAVVTFDDVSVCKEFAIRIVNILNGFRVEPCHFFDVILDELNR